MKSVNELVASKFAGTEIPCPQCLRVYAWLGDHGMSVRIHGRCIACILDDSQDDEQTDPLLEAVKAERELMEAACGRRVLPCVFGPHPGCSRCHDRGWLLGWAPGHGHKAPS